MDRPIICQIVPTKDHPGLLRRLFESLRGQESYLHQLVIVDGGTEFQVEDLCEEYGWLPISYIHISPPGLARQRNRGLELVEASCNLVGFWDDDLVIEPGCMKALYCFWKDASEEVGGSECNIVVGADPLVANGWIRSVLDKMFLLPNYQSEPGALLCSGANVTAFPAKETHETDWICGGANLYLREVFMRYQFDEWYNGYGLGDDVDFSYQVSLDYKLYVIADARVQHLMLPMNKSKEKLLGEIWATNQLHFVEKHRGADFNRLAGAWCILGLGVRHLLGAIRTREKPVWDRGIGYLSVLPSFFLGRLKPVDRQVK